MKKCMRMLLALAFVAALVLLCGAALAEEEVTIVASGSCGTNVTWQLDSAGELRISGRGAMKDYFYANGQASNPWYSKRNSILKLRIEDGITKIGKYAFYECSNLTSVSIPDSVISIGTDAFSSYDSKLEEAYVPTLAGWLGISFSSYRSNPVYYADKLYVGEELLTDLVIPEGITQIGNYAFCFCKSLTSVSIPDSVKSIGSSSFEGCSNLTSINIPDSVTFIDEFAFEYCTNLKSVSISGSKTQIARLAFDNCIGLEKVYVSSLEAWLGISFEDQFSNPMYYANELYVNGELLTNATIPDSVTSIGDYAFAYCSSLISISIPQSVKNIGEYAFYMCNFENVSIPDSVTSIKDYAFYSCDSLKSVSISNSVTSIGFCTFYGCSSLESVSIGDGVTNIGEGAFYACSSLESISIPEGVTKIDWMAFGGCSALKDVYYAGTKAEWAEIAIEEGNECLSTAILHCSDEGIEPELKADAILYLPKETRTIADEAFLNGSFEAVELPEGCETIGTKAFAGCDKLVYIRMPDSVTSIADDAFEGCNVTFICESDNAAAAYAKERDIDFMIDD